MADRFWVGGTASWDGTAGTKWATTSGGAGGASVPTSADNVFFDANSGANTVTVSATGLCNNLTFTGFTGTLAGSSPIAMNGSLLVVSGMTWTHSGTLSFAGANDKTITSAGKTLGAITIAPNGGVTVGLNDALTSSGAITVNFGIFTTNNYNVTASSLSSSNSNTRAINLGSSTVTLSSNSAITFTTNTNLTFNAGTSSIVLTASNASVTGGSTTGVTFYNVTFSGTNAATGGIFGQNTFNNLTVTGPASAGVIQIQFDSRQTINGTFSTTGTAGNRRVWFRSNTYGIAQTLTINSAPSLTDADFRDIYVVGTAAPISGTRIGDLRGCRGITFSTPKTVYWSQAAGGNWSGTNWSDTVGGAPSNDFFPLAQDTAKIVNTGLNSGATIVWDSAILYTGTLDMSARTVTMTQISTGASGPTFYGDLLFGSATGAVIGMNSPAIFSGRNTQTITSNGKSPNGAGGFNIDSYGGTVQLADALNIGTNTLTVTNGTFDTKNYNVTAGGLSSSNSNVRTITLGSSTVTLSGTTGPSMNVTTNLTFNAGTSQINLTAENTNLGFFFGGLTYYNVSFTGTAVKSIGLSSTATTTFNNLTVTAPASAGLIQLVPSGNIVVNGTLTVAGASAVRRIFLRSDTLGTTRTLTVNSLSATDCDFRDITIAGTAAGSSPTRAGDCGGNTGITFPSPKTVYWNLAGAQNWSATGWASSSGGSPDINNFPLAQDTAVFDDTGSVTGNISINTNWNIGTFDASGRTSAMTLTNSGNSPLVYGDWKFGTGVSSVSTTGAIIFARRGTQTITSNGVTFGCNVTVDCFTGTVQLADALTLNSARTLTHASGTFDAVSYNVTTGLFNNSSTSTASVLKMGSGTWTLSGTGTIWNTGTLTFYKGTANIVLSDTSTTARTFNGGGLSYNKFTIGGTTGTSTLTINGNNQFTELASTKTVAHTIALGTTTQTFGKWSVTGTIGNVVTVTGTATIIIAGAAVSGVDYLAMGTTAVSATSPGEFYAGSNSTGTGANVIKTAAPAPRTLYWVGGTGNWNDTAHWSTSSGGASGAAIPTSLDAVNFDSASNATAYTVTVNAASLRCGSLTMAGPASGNVTWAGSNPLYIHGNVSLAATGITRTYTGAITLSSSSTGLTFTTNGVSLSGATVTVNGVGCSWSLGSSLTLNTASISYFTLINGAFDTAGYTLTAGSFRDSGNNGASITLGSSSISLPSSNSISWNIASYTTTVNAGTSTISIGTGVSGTVSFIGAGNTYYNLIVTTGASCSISGANTFNDVTVNGNATAGCYPVSFAADQTINGTLTLSAGTNATMRTFVRSDTIGTTRTLTCAAVASLTDIDFRDIAIAGAAVSGGNLTGTRLGDCKGNSGITFDAPKTVYFAVASGSWNGGATWSATNGGVADSTQFPLAQDTAVFPSSPTPYPSSGVTVNLNAAYNIGTIDMSARTSNTMTLATGTNTPTIYGNWINGTGTTLSGTGTLTFAGRGSQTITSAGKTWTQAFNINNPSGSVTLQDAFSTSNSVGPVFTVTAGTFDASSYNVTFTSTGSGTLFQTSGTITKTVAFGSGTWTLAGSGSTFNLGAITNLTVTGTGTISLTSASAKTFAGGGLSYSGITLDQGGAGALTITGNNTFKDITNSYSATGATNITLGTTTQTVTQFTATGTSGKVLTVQGTSASSPGTLILTSGTVTTPDYLTITGVRAYNLTDTWYAGANSTNNGSLGWYFSAGSAPVVLSTGNFFFFF